MERFHIIDEGAVIVQSRGVYKQCKVYRRGKDIFAAHGNGFVRLHAAGGTSYPKVSWLDLEAPGVECKLLTSTLTRNSSIIISGLPQPVWKGEI